MIRFCFCSCCLLVCLLATRCAFAQQSSYNYFYRNNWQLVNPAAIDRSHYLTRNHPTVVLNGGSRLQWLGLGLGEAPVLYFASAEYCPESQQFSRPNYKLGVTAYGDRTDAISTYGFYLNYSYFFTLPWGRGHTLHLGGSAGYVQYNVDDTRLRGSDINDPMNINDPIVQRNKDNRSLADFALGAMYRVRKEFYLGISIPQIFGRDSVQARKVKARQINLTGGWFIDRGDRNYNTNYDDDYDFLIEPSFIVRYAPDQSYSTLRFLKNTYIPVSVDINLRFHYRSKVWYGGGISTTGNLNLEGGLQWDAGNDSRMSLGAAYGIPVFQRFKGFGHSVEATVGYYFR